MRQLGGHRLDHQPPGAGPGQQKADAGLVAPRDAQREAGRHEQDRGKEARRRRQQIIAGQHAVAFLPAHQLAGEIIAQRLFQEFSLTLDGDGDQPGQDQQQQQQHPAHRPRFLQPGQRAGFTRLAPQPQVPAAKADDGDQRHPGHHGKLDQDAGGARRPSPQDHAARRRGHVRIARGAVQPQQHALHRQHAGQQHRIGGGQDGLAGQQRRAQHQQPGQQRAFRAGHGSGDPHGRPRGRDGAQKRGQAIGPDVVVPSQEGARQLGGGGLQPIDPHRLLVAGDMAEADIHPVAAFHHLAGGLGKAAFIPVQRGQAQDPRQPEQQPQNGQQGLGAPRQHRQPAGRRGRIAQNRAFRRDFP